MQAPANDYATRQRTLHLNRRLRFIELDEQKQVSRAILFHRIIYMATIPGTLASALELFFTSTSQK